MSVPTLSRLLDRIRHALGTGTTKTPAQDGGGIQTVQVKFNDLDTRDNVPVLYHFGFSASPPVGTEIAVIALQGDPSSALAIASNNQALRPRNLQLGETIVYDALGRSLKLAVSAGVVLEAATSPVVIKDATTVSISASGEIDIVTSTFAKFASGSVPGGNPPSGSYFLYVDPADNKLKVRGPSGTIGILAVP